MNKADRILAKKWHQREDPYYPPYDPTLKTRQGNIQLVQPNGRNGVSLFDEDRFFIKDVRTGMTVLTFLHIPHRSQEVKFSGGQGTLRVYNVSAWEAYSGLVREPSSAEDDTWLTTWGVSEFQEAFSSKQRWATINACLKLIGCPTCDAWTGGGICFGCARDGTIDIMGGLRERSRAH